jgi:steroid delta-isomerase-like uncharacterized protein
MSEIERDAIREATERIFNRGELDYVDEMYAEDVVAHNVSYGEDYEGRESFRQWIEGLREAFPDFEVEDRDVVVGDEKFVVQFVVRGTHEGHLAGFDLEPTGESVEYEGVSVHRRDDEKVTEAWWYYDRLGILQQLGVAPGSIPE